MSITLIRNETGKVLELWDAKGDPLVTIPNGQAAQHLPITIINVSVEGVLYAKKQGVFMSGDSYSAKIEGRSVVFTGNRGTVTFT